MTNFAAIADRIAKARAAWRRFEGAMDGFNAAINRHDIQGAEDMRLTASVSLDSYCDGLMDARRMLENVGGK